MQNNIAVYMFIMAAVTYLIRMLPLALIKKKLQTDFLNHFYIMFRLLRLRL